MATIEYIIPVVYTAEDNNSHVNKDSILIKDCSQLGNPSPECDGYNFNKCPNDDAYCQPFIKGDVIYNQYRIDNKKYKRIFVDVIDSTTGLPVTEDVTIIIQTGVDAERTDYLNVIIDTDQDIFDTLTCWYVKISLYGCLLTEQATAEAYFTCLDEKQVAGLTLAQAQRECYEEMCNIGDFIASEPYCVVRCEEKTLMICGEYTDKDCNGNYYGNLIQPSQQESINQFKSCYRVRAVIEPNGFAISETLNNLSKVKSQQREAFLFIVTTGIPYYVAKQIAQCFNSKQLTIDGVAYSGAVKLDKNFEEGSMWYPRENIFIDCEEINFTCE